MGIGVSIFLIAVGAILKFAVHVRNTSGINIATIGVILMIVGAIGLLMSTLIFGSWRNRSVAGPAVVERNTVVDRTSYPAAPVAPVVEERTTYREQL